MAELVRAQDPFRFYTRLNLTELTGLKASTLPELEDLIRQVPGSCIYHHTHRFLQQHQYLSPEPPNDFAYWATQVLGEEELGERLASIDTVQFSEIRSLREQIQEVVSAYRRKNPSADRKFAREGQEFHFIKSVSFVLPTNYVVYDLKEFAEALKKITIDSIYFHIFEARLRLGKKTNDFSYWIATSLGDEELADRIVRLDPYTQTLESLRNTLFRIVERKVLRG